MATSLFNRRQFIKLSGLAGLNAMALSSSMPVFGKAWMPTSSDADFYVATNGNDKATGTSINTPFATLSRARDAVRKHKMQFPQKDIVVLVRGGRYQLDETLVFSLEDSGSANANITYAAYPGETPIFSSGSEVSGWTKLTEDLPGLPSQAKGNVMVANVSNEFKTLYDDQGMLPRARTEGFVSAKKGRKDQLHFPKGAMRNWSNLEDAELFVRPHHAWIVNVLPLKSVDVKRQVAQTKVNATYAMNYLHFLKTTDNCHVENIVDGLNKPGSWMLNSEEGKVYLWPRGHSKVFAPQLQELILIEGDIDKNGAKDTPVQNLRFIGLSFMHADRHTLTNDDAGIQHDWEMFDKPHAMFRLRGTQDCVVANCHFSDTGAGAIRMDLHGMNNIIADNKIEHIGSTGIFLCGYGPGTKDVNKNNIVCNNHIHHTGRVYSHGPGILVWQSGENQVTNNLIHNTPYTGLIISGCMNHFFAKGNGRELTRTIRWHEVGGSRRQLTREQVSRFQHTRNNVFADNEIHHAMEALGDGNAIYIRGAGAGNIIRRNYVHHLVAPMIMQAAIRTDGGQTDTLITENIIYKCTSQGILTKLNNHVENNIIVDIIAPPRGYYMSLREGPMTGALIKRNILYSTTENCEFINELPAGRGRTSEDRRGRALARAQDTDMDNNIYFCAAKNDIAENQIAKHQAEGVDTHSLSLDPMFKDVKQGDFRLRADSPAFKLGIRPIDVTKIGLLKSNYYQFN